MRIGVDIRSLLSATGRGVSHYTQSVLQEMITQNPQDRFIVLQTGRRSYELPPELDRPNVVLKRYRWPNKALNALQATVRRPKLDDWTDAPDVFFAPNLGFLSLTPATPLVVTVHDLSFIEHAEWYAPRERLWQRAVRPRRILAEAAKVIAISEQTKQEIRRTYGVDEGKITVIHSGIDDRYFQPVTDAERRRIRQKYALPERYILFMGALEPRKNIETLLATYRLAKRSGLGAELVLAGQSRHGYRHQPDVHGLGYVAEEDKPALYAEARLLALLSHHEGFGFPPLEALAVGTPSLVSDLPVFSETLGDACVKVAATDVAAAAEKLVHLDQDKPMRERIISEGAEPLKRLRWSACAKATHSLLARAAGERHG